MKNDIPAKNTGSSFDNYNLIVSLPNDNLSTNLPN